MKESANIYIVLPCALGCKLSPEMFCFHKIPFFVATVRFSLEKLRLEDVEKSSFSKEFSKHILWIDIVYGVKIQDVEFILSFSSIIHVYPF